LAPGISGWKVKLETPTTPTLTRWRVTVVFRRLRDRHQSFIRIGSSRTNLNTFKGEKARFARPFSEGTALSRRG